MGLPPASVAPARSRIPTVAIGVGGVIVALIAISLVLVLALPDGPTAFEPDSPEATVQEFFHAYEARDIDGAYGLLSPRIREQLTLSEYRHFDDESGWQRDEDRRVVLVRADITGDRASLYLRIDQFSGGGLGNARYSQDRTIRLVREDGAWLIDEPILGSEYVPFDF